LRLGISSLICSKVALGGKGTNQSFTCKIGFEATPRQQSSKVAPVDHIVYGRHSVKFNQRRRKNQRGNVIYSSETFTARVS